MTAKELLAPLPEFSRLTQADFDFWDNQIAVLGVDGAKNKIRTERGQDFWAVPATDADRALVLSYYRHYLHRGETGYPALPSQADIDGWASKLAADRAVAGQTAAVANLQKAFTDSDEYKALPHSGDGSNGGLLDSIGNVALQLPLVGGLIGEASTATGISPGLISLVGLGVGLWFFGVFDSGSSHRR